MNIRLIYLFFFCGTLFGEVGGFDNGTSSGKGNLDISLTWNPNNFFENGQDYIVLGYGMSKNIDLNYYYSHSKYTDNYYYGISYQFYRSSKLDLSTGLGVRNYTDKTLSHLFYPQLLFSYKINHKFNFGGSLVDIRCRNGKNSEGIAYDVFLRFLIKKKIFFTIGAFNPVLWKSQFGDWHPTYSIVFKI